MDKKDTRINKKEAILQAATCLFASKGFKDTSMVELSRMTGAAEGTIFYHFKNKQDIFLTILRGLKDAILPEFDQYLRQDRRENGLGLLEQSIAFYLHMAQTKVHLFAILHFRYPYEIAEVNPECRDILEAIYECFVDIFEQAILTGQQDGSIDPAIAPRKSALIVFALVDSMVRFRMNHLYDVAALYPELIESCRRMLAARVP